MLIFQLAIILVAAKIAGKLSARLGQPPVLGELLIGVILGPSVLGIIHETEVLTEFGQIGVIFLMFIAGLSTDVGEFKRTGKASTFVGMGGVIASLILGYFAGIILNLSPIESILLGLLLSATSVGISVQILKEVNRLQTREGATILGAAVIDDVVVIIFFAFLMSFAGGDVNLTLVVLKKVIFFVGAVLVGWKVVPWFLNRFATLKVTETVTSSALIICFVFAYGAEHAGIAAIIGAYIAGVAISVTNFKHEVTRKVGTISYSMFIPVFFVSIGVTTQFSGIVENVGLVIFLSIVAILSKLVGASLGAKLAGFNLKSSLGIGSSMVARGGVALIIAATGLGENLLTEDMFAVIIVVIFITIIVTPPMMKWFFTSKQAM